MRSFNMYDVVKLKHPRANDGLDAGAVGTIVMAYDFPRPGYEVEFTTALLTLYDKDLELVERHCSS